MTEREPERDPVEVVFDAVQATLDAHSELTSHWSALDVKRFAELAKSYMVQGLTESRKRPRNGGCGDHDCDGDHDGCQDQACGEGAAASADEVDNSNDALKPVLTDSSEVADALFRFMSRVRTNLRPLAPFGSIEEVIHRPKLNPNFDLEAPTIDVDAFLFDQNDIDNLVEDGKLSRHYCRACHSVDIGDTQFISHSFSAEQLVYLFSYALPLVAQTCVPEERRKQLVICDVGSRLGIVVAAASFFAANSGTVSRGPQLKSSRVVEQSSIGFQRVIGIELNEQLCKIQRGIIGKLRLDTSVVNIHCGDALSDEGAELMRSSDVVVLHNVFEWFQEESKQLEVWRTLRKSILCRPGQIILAVPTLEESLSHLAEAFKESGLDSVTAVKTFVDDWVKRVDLNDAIDVFKRERLFAEGDGEEEEDEAAQDARDETLELVSLMNFYVVK